MEMLIGLVIGAIMAFAFCKIHYNRRLFNAFWLWVGRDKKISPKEFDIKQQKFKNETKGLIALFDEKGKQV